MLRKGRAEGRSPEERRADDRRGKGQGRAAANKESEEGQAGGGKFFQSKILEKSKSLFNVPITSERKKGTGGRRGEGREEGKNKEDGKESDRKV